MLAEFTKNDKDTRPYRKSSITDLDQNPFCPLMFLVFSSHHLLSQLDVSVI